MNPEIIPTDNSAMGFSPWQQSVPENIAFTNAVDQFKEPVPQVPNNSQGSEVNVPQIDPVPQDCQKVTVPQEEKTYKLSEEAFNKIVCKIGQHEVKLRQSEAKNAQQEETISQLRRELKKVSIKAEVGSNYVYKNKAYNKLARDLSRRQAKKDNVLAQGATGPSCSIVPLSSVPLSSVPEQKEPVAEQKEQINHVRISVAAPLNAQNINRLNEENARQTLADTPIDEEMAALIAEHMHRIAKGSGTTFSDRSGELTDDQNDIWDNYLATADRIAKRFNLNKQDVLWQMMPDYNTGVRLPLSPTSANASISFSQQLQQLANASTPGHNSSGRRERRDSNHDRDNPNHKGL